MIMSFKKHVHELEESVNGAGSDDKATYTAILVFAKDTEAILDKYQLSIGNQEEVERSRKRTLFLRRQVKPLFVKYRDELHLELTADELEAFEHEGIWTPKAI